MNWEGTIYTVGCSFTSNDGNDDRGCESKYWSMTCQHRSCCCCCCCTWLAGTIAAFRALAFYQLTVWRVRIDLPIFGNQILWYGKLISLAFWSFGLVWYWLSHNSKAKEREWKSESIDVRNERTNSQNFRWLLVSVFGLQYCKMLGRCGRIA